MWAPFVEEENIVSGPYLTQATEGEHEFSEFVLTFGNPDMSGRKDPLCGLLNVPYLLRSRYG